VLRIERHQVLVDREPVAATVLGYSFRYSRRRLVWDRLTGISVPFASFILRM
jgi:hypothetical protein